MGCILKSAEFLGSLAMNLAIRCYCVSLYHTILNVYTYIREFGLLMVIH